MGIPQLPFPGVSNDFFPAFSFFYLLFFLIYFVRGWYTDFQGKYGEGSPKIADICMKREEECSGLQ